MHAVAARLADAGSAYQNCDKMNGIEDLRRHFESYLSSLSYAREPMALYDPISYTLALGGKRLRPLMALAACSAFSGDFVSALPLAGALEIYHNHTLLHDDVMDNADLRRGRPTVHAKWGDNAAILSGDTMLILAYKQLLSLPPHMLPPVMAAFTEMALQICEGQQLDMEFETRSDVTADDYLGMTRLKTAVFFATALQCGAKVGGAGDDDAALLYEAGINFGLAFQLQDDLLDVYGDTLLFGKNTGGDIVSNKKTYLRISALNAASPVDRRELEAWMARKTFDAGEKISIFKAVYERTDVRSSTEARIDAYFAAADEALSSLGLPASEIDGLRSLVFSSLHRKM